MSLRPHRPFHRFAFIAALASFMFMAPLSAHAAQTVHLWLTVAGTEIEGESTVSSLNRGDTIQCFSFSQAGFKDLTRGTRSYRPVTIMKRIDQTTPLLYQAWAQNQNVDEAIFRFYRPNPQTGADENYYTVVLENGKISSVAAASPSTVDPETATQPVTEMLSFTFETITFIDEINGTAFQDTVSGGQ